jgi:hypothetical protein
MEYRQLVRLSNSEVEDYSVNIVEASTNTSPPTIPTNLTASGTTASSKVYHGLFLRMM